LICHARLQKVTVVRANRANWILLFLELRLYFRNMPTGPNNLFVSANVNAGNSEFLYETSSDNCNCLSVPYSTATSRSFSTDTFSLIPGWSRTMRKTGQAQRRLGSLRAAGPPTEGIAVGGRGLDGKGWNEQRRDENNWEDIEDKPGARDFERSR
jgi:hypothetical protein